MSITISRLTKVYGTGESAVIALNEFDLTLAPNELCIVRGPNGSGKTTLISILSGEIGQTSGSVRLVSESGAAPSIAVIGQFHNLIDELTVAEHFDVLGNHENVGLIDQELLDRRCAELSRGQAQIVAIALALNSATDLLLADEPTGALGAAESAQIYDFIKSTARRNGISVLLVTHDVHADRIADRIVRLRDGRLSETWTHGAPEKQVVSDTGWVRIPELVRDGLSSEVMVTADTSGVNISGRVHAPRESYSHLTPRASGSTPVIVANDVSTYYGNHVVSSDLSFAAYEGELFCVLGKSGAGKSTLLRTLAGLHAEFTGEVTAPTVLPYFNAESMFGLGLRLSDFSIDADLIERLQLSELLPRRLETFSGGQQQRALVAIALSSAEPVILLDEPTSALDDAMAAAVIAAILDSDKTIVVATHDDRLQQVANRTVEL